MNKEIKEDWKFLKEIYEILENGKVLDPQDEPIVQFRHPEELKVKSVCHYQFETKLNY